MSRAVPVIIVAIIAALAVAWWTGVWPQEVLQADDLPLSADARIAVHHQDEQGGFVGLSYATDDEPATVMEQYRVWAESRGWHVEQHPRDDKFFTITSDARIIQLYLFLSRDSVERGGGSVVVTQVDVSIPVEKGTE